MQSTDKLVLPKDPRDLINLYDAASKIRLYKTLQSEISSYIEEYLINHIIDKDEVLSTLGETAKDWTLVGTKREPVTSKTLDKYKVEDQKLCHTRRFVMILAEKEIIVIDNLFNWMFNDELDFAEYWHGYNRWCRRITHELNEKSLTIHVLRKYMSGTSRPGSESCIKRRLVSFTFNTANNTLIKLTTKTPDYDYE